LVNKIFLKEDGECMTEINELLNQPVTKIGRASNLCWMMFGETFIEKDIFGKEVEKGEFSLHLQCPWRIRDTINSVIKLASGDMYEPNSNMEWSENFEWDIQGNNLFDEKVKNLFPKDIPVYVKSAAVLENGDLTILFSNMFVLECFINISTAQECWRFFKCGDKEHLVVCGNGYEF